MNRFVRRAFFALAAFVGVAVATRASLPPRGSQPEVKLSRNEVAAKKPHGCCGTAGFSPVRRRGRVIDALGNVSSTTYDYFDRPIRQISPATAQTGTGQGEVRTTYAFRGGPVTMKQIYDEAGNPARTLTWNYGNEGEVLAQSGNQDQPSIQYDAMYRTVGFLDGLLRRTSFLFDADGRLIETRHPNGSATGTYDRERTTSFDASGLPLQAIDGRGVVSNIAYTPDGLPSNVSYPASTWENVSLSYDDLGRPQGRTDGAGSETWNYNAAGAMNSQTTTYKKADYTPYPAWTLGTRFNADGSRSQLSTPLGNLGYSYDGGGRLASLTGLDGTSTTWNYLDNDWLSGQNLPVGVQTSYAFNALGQTLALVNNRLSSTGAVTEKLSQWGDPTDTTKRLQYNPSGQMLRHTSAATATYSWAGDTSLSYEGHGWLNNETSARGAGYNQSFGYDNAGNPTSWKGQARTFDGDNIETTGGNYANNGDGSPWKYLNRNLTTTALPGGMAQIFSYNSQGQLNQINAMNTDGSGGALLSYSVYRGDGKRAWKQSPSGSRTYFFYDGDTLIGTSGDAANSSSLLLWGADGLIGTQSKNATGVVNSGYFLYDAQGNLAQTVNGTGVVTPVAAYTAWGEVVPKADGTKPSLGAFGYGAKFGYWRDSDSGLYLCTLRFYDPSNGRWITRDPIGFAGGSNLFGYTGNDPANATDPSGLATDPQPKSNNIRIVFNAFIPTPSVSAPLINNPLFGTGHGDDRGFSPNGGSFRVAQTIVINPKTGTSTSWEEMGVSVVSGTMFGLTGDLAMPGTNQSSLQTYVTQDACRGGWNAHIEGNPKHGFTPFGIGPGITYRFQLHISPKGDVSGYIGAVDAYPAYEIWRYMPNSKPTLLYGQMPGDYATVLNLLPSYGLPRR